MSRNRRITRLWSTVVLASAGGAAFPYCALAAQDSASGAAYGVNAKDDIPEQVLFEADTVYRESDDGPIIAEGDVRAYFGERFLRADRLTYNPDTNVVTAEGDISITDPNMETLFAGKVILSGDLRDGVIENFSALLQENAKLAAANAVQIQGARTRLTKAVYTSCDVCKKNGDEKTPTWRIKALRVTRDLERKVVRFHHAFIELKGVPILYTPYLQGPDPSVERQSGFLTPRIGASSRLGFNFQLPYYLAISNSQDATFFPKFTAQDGVLWQGEYRLREKNGYHVLSGGVIDYNNNPDPNDPNDTHDASLPGVRWHYFGRGYHDFSDHVRVSYDFERVSDNTYLRRYDVRRTGDLREALDRTTTNQLRSNARLLWTDGGSRLSFDTYLFQGLRTQDDPATTPYILPLIDFQHKFKSKVAGGDASVSANIASIYRTEGADSQRFTASADWGRDIITSSGHRFNFFAQVRGDAYRFQDIDQGTEIYSGVVSDKTTQFESRFAPTVGVEWSYPLVRQAGGARLFLEPRVQLAASPSHVNDAAIFNEDSQSIEFDYASLFDVNKATGYDAFEDGQRLNAGLAASAVWPGGLSVEISAGQQFRLQTTDAFSASSGLGGKESNIVGSFNLRYDNLVGVENSFRLDADTGALKRVESLAYVSLGPVTANASYVRLDDRRRREELKAGAKIKFAKHWSTGAAWRLNLISDTTITQDFSLNYEDECSIFGITYRRDGTRDTNLEPDKAILITFSLKGLVQ